MSSAIRNVLATMVIKVILPLGLWRGLPEIVLGYSNSKSFWSTNSEINEGKKLTEDLSGQQEPSSFVT